MGKQTVVRPYLEILLSNKKERSIGICNNLDEPQWNDAEWKKPISKGYIPYCSIYIAFLNDRSLEMENISIVARG